MNVVIMFLTAFVVQAINLNESTIVIDFVNCVSDLIETNYNKPGLLIFLHTFKDSSIVERTKNDILKRIHNSNKYTIQVISPDNDAIRSAHQNKDIELVNKVMLTARYFVIIVKSYDDFTYLVQRITRSRSWNPHAKFIILLFRIVKHDMENHREVESLLKCLFNYNVINVIVIAPETKYIRNALIYSWKPYDPPNFCGYYNESARNRLIIEKVCDRGIVTNKNNIYQYKIPSNMHRCTIYILGRERQPFISKYKHDPNIEKNLITDMLKRYNFSINVQTINIVRGERDENGTWNGAFRKLLKGEGQILLGGIYPDVEIHEDFECSSTYLMDSYVWVVPKANLLPSWSSLTAAFNNIVWYLAIFVFIVSVLTWKILGQLSGDTNYNRMFDHCYLNTWMVFLGFPGYIRPTKISLRVFFVILNLYCILFITAYQTKLIDILRNPNFGNQIKTLPDLVKSGLKWGGSEELHDLFYNSSDPFGYSISQEWIDVNNISKALLDVVLYRNFSVLCSRLQLAYLSGELPELSDSFGHRNYYAFRVSTFLVSLEMVGLKGFPFMKKISHTLSLYKQLGLDEYARRYFRSMNKRKRERLLRSLNVRRNTISPLSMQHLQSGFFILILGMSCGVVILLIEIG